ncbi:hypothetical protein Q7689_10510, partial [Nocardiopsis tropica]|nr:hypothetical protein [Nocardiopsis tropica]
MFASRHALPSLLAASALLFACGATPSLAGEENPSVDAGPSGVGVHGGGASVDVGPSGVSVHGGGASVDVGPSGVSVNAPGALVEVRAGSYVLVCANGVRVLVHHGEAPACPPYDPPPPPPEPEVPPVPEEPERP